MLPKMSKEDESLLIYFHYCASNWGLVSSQHMNNDDFEICLPTLEELGYIRHFGRLKAKDIQGSSTHPPKTHLVALTHDGFEMANKLLEKRQERWILKAKEQGYKITEDK